jgi:hypothetical protein
MKHLIHEGFYIFHFLNNSYFLSSNITNATSSSNSSNPHVSVRQQEKDYLQHLNDRLAGYIEVFVK